MAEKAAKEKKGGKKPLPMIIGAVVVILVLLFAGKSVLGGKANNKAEKKVAAEVGISLPLDEFLVNLTGEGDHYLRTTISLGMKKGLTEEQVKEHTAAMRDAILSVLSSKSLKQLAKPDDREALKEELKKKVNESSGEENVVKVYFTAFATQ